MSAPPPPPPPPPPPASSSELFYINAPQLVAELEDVWSGKLSIDVSDATITLTTVQYALLGDEARAAALPKYPSGHKVDLLLFTSALHCNAKKSDESFLGSMRAKVLRGIHDQANSNCQPDEESLSVEACFKFKLVTLLGKTICLTNEKTSFMGTLLRLKRSDTHSITLRVAKHEVGVNTASLADGTVTVIEEGEEGWLLTY